MIFTLTETLTDIAIRMHAHYNWALTPTDYTRNAAYGIEDTISYAHTTVTAYTVNDWITLDMWIDDIITYMKHTYHGIPLKRVMGRDPNEGGDILRDCTPTYTHSARDNERETARCASQTTDADTTDENSAASQTTTEHPTDTPTAQICSYRRCGMAIDIGDGVTFPACDHVLHTQCTLQTDGGRRVCIVCYNDMEAVHAMFRDYLNCNDIDLLCLKQLGDLDNCTDEQRGHATELVAWQMLYGPNVSTPHVLL